MLNSLKLKVYAKVNLALDILGTADDGYHMLDTVMTSIDMYDSMTITPREDKQCTIKYMRGTQETGYTNDMAYSAALSFVGAFGTGGVDICVQKGIWDAAGLGGSSADIAGVLVGMAKLYDVELSAVYPLAATLGSDVTYMLTGGLARVTGRGEQVTPLPFKQLYFWLVKAKGGVSTAACYKTYDTMQNNTAQTGALAMVQALGAYDDNGEAFSGRCFNDLSAAASKLNPNLDNVERFMHDVSKRASMTGSGSAMFAFVSRENCNMSELDTVIARNTEYGNLKIDKYGCFRSVAQGIEFFM